MESTTPQASRDSDIFAAQVLACDGVLDFWTLCRPFTPETRLTTSSAADGRRRGSPECTRTRFLCCSRPAEGSQTALPWYQHLCRRLKELLYQTSRSDPCVFLHGKKNQKGGCQAQARDEPKGEGLLHWEGYLLTAGRLYAYPGVLCQGEGRESSHSPEEDAAKAFAMYSGRSGTT